MYFDLSMQFHCIMTTNVLQASVGILFISFLLQVLVLRCIM